MQHEAMRNIYALEHDVLRSGDVSLIGDWRRLQTPTTPTTCAPKWFHRW